MSVTLGAVPVPTPKYRHTGWDSTTNKALGRTKRGTRVGKWWYVPGEYNRAEDVDGVEYTRTNLTRFSGLASDAYSLDTTWQPDPNGRTYRVESDGTTVLATGEFTTIAGATRPGVAAFTAATGALTSFMNGLTVTNPSSPGALSVRAVAIDGAGNYWFGGEFSTFAGSSRTRLAVINPAGTVQSLNVACTQTVIDLKWDPVNSQMLVLMDNDGTIGGGATCKVAAVATSGTVNWRNNPNAGTFSFQVDCDQTYAYVATNGDNRTFQYLLTTGAAGAFTFWHTDGNNQGVTSYGGNVFIGHHGDFTASTANSTSVGPTSKGIVAISVAGVLQTWRPQFILNGSEPYGGGVLKIFDIAKDTVNNQVLFSGDFTQVKSADGTQTVNARRSALFVDASAPPPPPPPPSSTAKLIAAGDFTVGAGGLARVGTLVGTYWNAGDTVGMLALGDSAYQAGTLAEFNANLNPVMGSYMKKFGRDWWYPTPGSHDYGTWGTTGVSSVGITGYESYYRTAKALNIGAVGRYYRVDDVLAADGTATNWVILRVNGVKAQAGFAGTEAGVNDGLIVPLAAGSPQNDFLKTTLAGIAAAGKCAVVLTGHPRYTSPSTGNHSSELRINPLWQLLDQYLPGRAIVLSGHQHNYERFFPQRAGGVRDNVNGNVQFVVGIGGGAAYVRSSVLANSAAYEDNTNGVLELNLFPDHADYAWRKVTGETSSFSDAGTITMNVTPPPPPPPPGVNASGAGAAGSSVTVAKPTGVVSGNVLVAQIALTGADSLVTVPTGWTVVGTPDGVGSGGTTKVWQAVYKKTAGGSEPASYAWAAAAIADSIYVNIVSLPAGSTVGSPSTVKSASTGAMDIVGTGSDVTGLAVDDEVLVFSATDWGPRPWGDTGTLLGFMPNESTGDPVNDAGITRLEGLIGRDIAVGHSMYPSTGSDLAVQGTFPETAGSATGVTSDWESGRLSFVSWPRQEAWLYTTGQTPDQAPRIGLAEIANGDHDALIISWANKLKTWGQPTWFRPFWEMNGGDPPWSVGYETSGNVAAWVTAFKAAWQRVYVLMQGTQAQYDSLSPAPPSGTAPQADNLFFTWNPQEFESSPNASFNRDSNWPGAAYSDGAATELYLSPGDTATQKMTNAGGGGFGGIAHKPLYTEYAGVQGKRLATGEGGNRWTGSPDDAACITRTQGFTTMFKNYPAHAVFCWWDGGSTGGMGQSSLAGKPTALRNAENAFFNDAVMKPQLNTTLQPQPVGGFAVLIEGRAPVGKALTNYGPAQLSGTVLRKHTTTPTVTAPIVKGYGYGRFITTTLPISSGGVVVTNPPTITSFSPTSGPIGTLITITGTNLLAVDTITYSPGTTGAYTHVSDTQLTSNVVSGAVTGTFTVHNPDGTATSPSAFTVTAPPPPPPAPTITSFSPTSGGVGTVVTLTGSSFTTATSVVFVSNKGAFFTILSDTSIQATVPAGAVTGVITVTNPQGSGATGTSFTVASLPPVVNSLTPASGPVGTAVGINGSRLANVSDVKFNGTTAIFVIVNDSRIDTNVPTGATTGTVTVTNPDGTTTVPSFTVTTVTPPSAPTVTSFAPSSGIRGSTVVITGTTFTGATRVRFNGVDAIFTVDSATQITATVPATATSGTIAVTNSVGTGTSAGSFTVTLQPPVITSFTPVSGSTGTQVTLTGSRFTGASLVKFNTVAATFTVISATTIQTNVPATATTGTITVTNPDGTGTSSTSFTISAPSAPSVASFSPTTGPPGSSIDITGTNFSAVTGVTFNGLAANFAVISGNLLRATVPGGATTGLIVLTNSVGTGNSPSSFVVSAAATSFWWRVRVKDAAGNTSAWSDPVHVYVLSKGSLTINAPTVLVEETTPTISTTLGGRAQAAISYTLEEQQVDGTWDEVWHQRRMKAAVPAGTSYDFDVPKIEREGHPHGKRHSPIRKRNTDYRLTVKSWDAEEDRVHTPDDPPYAEAVRIFQWQGGPHNPGPTIGLTATPDGAGVVLEWSRLAVPDAWTLIVDDEVVHEPDAIDWQLSGTAYRATYYGATPMSEHTYEVAAVSISGGHRYVSNGNPTATATTHPIGIWLADAVIDSEGTPANVIQMLGQPDSPAVIGQAAETFTPVGRRDPVTIYDSLRGYEDTIDGAIVQSAADLELLEAMKGETGLEVRLIMGEMNIPVEIGQLSIGRMPVDATMFPVSISVTQVDDFAINLKQRGD